MQYEFSGHSIERLLGRLSPVISYGEAQTAVSRFTGTVKCQQRIVLKRLSSPVTISDPTAIGGKVRGDKVYAHVRPLRGGFIVDTVCLDF